MSNNPFTQPGSPQPPGASFPPGYPPGYPPQGMPQQPRKDNINKTILIILSVIGVIGLLICGGVGILGYIGYRAAANAFNEIAMQIGAEHTDQIRDSIGEAAELKSEIGEIQSITFDVSRTMNEATDDDMDTGGSQWFKVTGSKAEASLQVKFSDQENATFKSITLVTSDGRQIPLTIKQLPYSDDVDREVWLSIRDEPQLAQAIGAITRLEYAPLENEADDEMRYQITGEKGVATAIVRSNDEGVNTSIELTLPDETKVTVVPK